MLFYPKWISLPLVTRQGLAQQFGVAKTRSTHVVNDVVSDDGYDIHALDSAFTDDKLREYTGSNEKDPVVLWDLMVTKFTTPVEVLSENPVEELVTPEPGTVEETMSKPEKIPVEAKKTRKTK